MIHLIIDYFLHRVIKPPRLALAADGFLRHPGTKMIHPHGATDYFSVSGDPYSF